MGHMAHQTTAWPARDTPLASLIHDRGKEEVEISGGYGRGIGSVVTGVRFVVQCFCRKKEEKGESITEISPNPAKQAW